MKTFSRGSGKLRKTALAQSGQGGPGHPPHGHGGRYNGYGGRGQFPPGPQNQFHPGGGGGGVGVVENGSGSGSTHNKKNVVSSKPIACNATISKGSLPDKYYGVGDNDAMKFSDFNHPILGGGVGAGHNGKLQNQFMGVKGLFRDPKSVEVTSHLIASAAKKKPVVKILTKDFNLDEHVKPWCCFGKTSWEGRRFAQELSSGLSSQAVITGNGEFLDAVDFVADWKNVKTLLKSHSSNTHLSFVLHRVGNAVTIDELNLFELECFPNFLQTPAELQNFIKSTVGGNKEKIKCEGRSNKEVLSKEAFHKLLHCSMLEENMEENVTNQFLHRYMVSAEGFKFMVGCDIPTFALKGDKSDETVTVRARDAGSATIKPSEAFDIWLDNKLVQSSKTLMTSLEATTVTKTEWLTTEELSNGQFNATAYLQNVGKLFQMLRENVKVGHTYWLYRAPDSYETTLYNMSNICSKSTDGSPVPVVGNWESVSPFGPYFASASFIKYSESLSEAIAEQLISETFFEQKADGSDVSVDMNVNPNKKCGKKSEQNNKHQKLTLKIANQVKSMKKYAKCIENWDWVISDLENIRSQNFEVALKCVENIYSSAVSSTPTIRNRLYTHAVEKYYPVCSKILRALGSVEDHLKIWDGKEEKRKWFLNYTSAVCDILSLLSEWHGKVGNTSGLAKDRHAEWMFLGSRINELRADMLFSITSKLLENRAVRADEDFTGTCYYDRIIDFYRRAMDMIPEEESFRVKQCFVPPASDGVIHRKAHVKEIHNKMSIALINRIHYQIRFPSFLCDIPGSPQLRDATKGEKSERGAGDAPTKNSSLPKVNDHLSTTVRFLDEYIGHLNKGDGGPHNCNSMSLELANNLRAEVMMRSVNLNLWNLEAREKLYSGLKEFMSYAALSPRPSEMLKSGNGSNNLKTGSRSVFNSKEPDFHLVSPLYNTYQCLMAGKEAALKEVRARALGEELVVGSQKAKLD